MTTQELNRELGNIDLYLLDAILKGHIPKDGKILDAGCGEGRNLVYLLRNGYECYGADVNDPALRMLRFQLHTIAPGYPPDRFTPADLKNLSFKDEYFDVIICIAVLHFSENENDFRQMFTELMRVLKSGGKLLIRMTDDTGMQEASPLGDGKYQLPDGSVRFLLTSELRNEMIQQHSLRYIEPYKSVLVDGMRSMNYILAEKS